MGNGTIVPAEATMNGVCKAKKVVYRGAQDSKKIG